MLLLRPPVGMLRVTDRLAVVGHQSLLEARGAFGMVGYEQDAIGDGEGAEMERLVVQDAQREKYATLLEGDWRSAASSLPEGVDERLKINRLGLPCPRSLECQCRVDLSRESAFEKSRRSTSA
jgi:hypothetical protein